MKMNTSLRGSITSGLIAAVIYAIVAAATAGGLGVVLVGAVLIGLVTFLIALLITRAYARGRGSAQLPGKPPP